MSRGDTSGLLAIAPAIGAVAAFAAFGVFSVIATPARYDTRKRALGNELAQAQTSLRGSGDAAAYPAKAVCTTSPDQAALDLRQRLQAQAASAAVTVAEIAAAPAPSESPDRRLEPVTLQFSASGHYEQLVALLSTLAKSQPQIFVDTVDLRPDATNARLKFTGRVFCSSSARR